MSLLTFYARIILSSRNTTFIIKFSDLNISIEKLIFKLASNLEKEDKNGLSSELKKLITSKQILCWDKPCHKDTEFVNLLSKVEKIDGKEADVFELNFS
ncbi:MAG: hypothetical protein ACTSPD_06370 [Promethearchaeota archaeon]